MNKKSPVIYQAKNGEIKFRGDFSNETIWGSLNQIADLFGVQKAGISKHLKNIYLEGELDRDSTVSKMETVRQEGERRVIRNIEFYNLDAIISIGYRVNSKDATQFRIWATKTLKQHITKGYTINKKVIAKNYDSFMDSVNKIQKLLPEKSLAKTEDVLELVKAFSSTWLSLESYDEDKFPQKGFTKKDIKVQSEDLYSDLEKFKKNLIKKKQATELFALEKKQGSLEGILGNVFQSVFGKEVYGSIEEKAAHILYFVVKNHPFNDGNKRTGAFAFIWFLNKSRLSYKDKINPEALTALTLLVAESKPKEKDRIVGLILLLLKK